MGGMNQLACKFEGVFISPIQQIFHPKGDIFLGLKASDPSFKAFGEAYFTTVVAAETKGWKRHKIMTMNLIVPVGNVTFYLHHDKVGETIAINAGENNYVRLTVPPGLWIAFEGGAHPLNLVLNIASIEHDYNEADNAPLETYPLCV